MLAPAVYESDPRRNQSRSTTGAGFHLSRVDGRSYAGRRERDLAGKLSAELGVANIAELPFGLEQLARRVVRLSLECEIMEADRARVLARKPSCKKDPRAGADEPFDRDLYGRLCKEATLTHERLMELANARSLTVEPATLPAAQNRGSTR